MLIKVYNLLKNSATVPDIMQHGAHSEKKVSTFSPCVSCSFVSTWELPEPISRLVYKLTHWWHSCFLEEDAAYDRWHWPGYNVIQPAEHHLRGDTLDRTNNCQANFIVSQFILWKPAVRIEDLIKGTSWTPWSVVTCPQVIQNVQLTRGVQKY